MSWMVLPNNPKPSALKGLVAGLSEGLPAGLQALKESRAESKRKSNMKLENEHAKQFGIKLEGVETPELRKLYVQEGLKSFFENKNRKQLFEELGINEEDNNNFNPQAELESPSERESPDQNPSLVARGAKSGALPMQAPGMPEGATNEEPMRNQPKGQPKPRFSEKQVLGATLTKPALGAAMQRQNATESKERIAGNKAAKAEQVRVEDKAQKEKEFFHKETKKYDEALHEKSSSAESRNRALQRQMKDVNNIGWFDRAVSSVFGQSKFGDLLRSSTAQEFDSNVLPQLAGLRQTLGGVLSDSDIRLLLQKVVTASKSPEANQAIADWMMQEGGYDIARERIGEELKAKNGGYRPANYTAEVERIFRDRYSKEIQDTFSRISNLQEDPEKARKIVRRPVPPGSKLSPAVMKQYMEMYNNDKNAAWAAAQEDGYVG